MNITTIGIIIIVCTSIISLLISIMTSISLSKKNNSETNIKIESLNQLQVYKEIVNSYIDKYFNETLFYYLNKEITFDDNSSVKIQRKFNYRECIRNLMRPDVKLDGLRFKEVFTQRVYLYFIAETPKNIKNLIYSFHSGYDINNFFDKDKEKPSVSKYVIDRIDKMINQHFYEITKNEEMVFGNISNSGDTSEMDKRLKDIDTTFYSKLCSVIYNLNVIHGEIDIQNEEQYDKSKKPEGDKEK